MTEFTASNGVGVRYREDGSIEVTTLFGWALALPSSAADAVREFLNSEREDPVGEETSEAFPYPKFKLNTEHRYRSITYTPDSSSRRGERMLRVYDEKRKTWELIDHDSAEDCYREALDLLGIEYYWDDDEED